MIEDINILLLKSEKIFALLQQNLHGTLGMPEFLHRQQVWNPKLQFIQKPMALVSSSLSQTRAKETSTEKMGGRVDNSWGTKLK